jgi:hypothetical protein
MQSRSLQIVWQFKCCKSSGNLNGQFKCKGVALGEVHHTTKNPFLHEVASGIVLPNDPLEAGSDPLFIGHDMAAILIFGSLLEFVKRSDELVESRAGERIGQRLGHEFFRKNRNHPVKGNLAHSNGFSHKKRSRETPRNQSSQRALGTAIRLNKGP